MRVLTTRPRFLKLDAKDWKIISEIKNKARQPLTKIAEQCCLSRQIVEYRLKQMQEQQLITGYRTVVNVQKLGYKPYHVFMDAHTPNEEKELIKRAVNSDFVNALVLYSGRYNMEMSILARNEEEFVKKYAQLLEKIPVRKEQVLVLLGTIIAKVLPEKYIKKSTGRRKVFPRIAGKFRPAAYDKIDLKLLFLLSRDALKSNQALAQELSLSKDTVKYRLKRLEESGLIIEYRPAINYSALGLSINAVLINLNHDSERAEQFENFLKTESSVLWCARTFGYYDYLVYVINHNLDDFHDTINRMKAQFADMVKNYEVLFAYEEVKYEFMAKCVITDALTQNK